MQDSLVNPGDGIDPEFAQRAAEMMEAGLVEEAIAVAQDGTRQYPWYPTGFHILARAFEAQGNIPEALRAITTVAAMLPDVPFLAETATRLHGAAKHVTPPPAPPAEEAEDVEEPLPELPPDNAHMVSATLAEIYVQQGELGEAIRAYRALIDQEPEGFAKYGRRLDELEEMLRNQLFG